MNKENSEDVKVLEAQIERLREELVELERQKQNNYKDMTFSFTGEMQNALCVSFYFYYIVQYV